MKLLVNIRGCNGSGKSTIPMSMMDDPQLRVVSFNKGLSGKPIGPYITVFPTYGWVALGTYFNKTGGMDTISTNAEKQAALEYAWKEFPQYDILMEGVIDSTIRSTYINLFQEYERRMDAEEIERRKIMVLNFIPPVEVAIARVLDRNGGKPVKEDQIESKWRSVAKNVAYFKDAGILTLKLDTSKFMKEEMLTKFTKIVEKYRGNKCVDR